MSGTAHQRVTVAWRVAAGSAAAKAVHAQPFAIGWATVELDRATSELAEAFDLAGGRKAFLAAPRSGVLGAACRVAPGVLPGGGSLVALEPDTEGRLAGSLARLGEGPAVAWLASEEPATALEALRAAGFSMSTERDGPLGPERLVADGGEQLVGRGPRPRQLLLLIGRATGTIRP